MGGGIASKFSDRAELEQRSPSPALPADDQAQPALPANCEDESNLKESDAVPKDALEDKNEDESSDENNDSERPPTPDPILIRVTSEYLAAITSISSSLPPPPPRNIDFVEVPARGTLAPSLIRNLWIHAAYTLLNKHMPTLDVFAIADAKCKQMRSVKQIPQEMLHVVNILDLSTNRLVLYDIQFAQPFHYFESILCLNVSMNMLTSLSGVEFCRHLKMLVATDNKVVDMSPVATLAHLVHVDLSSNAITSLPTIYTPKAHALLHLSLHHNPLTSLARIEQFSNLQELDVSYCAITEINDLKVLPGLKMLDAVYNKIDDIHAVGKVVATLSTLRHVRLLGNPCQVNNPPHVYEIALLLHSQLETLDRRVVTENDHKRFRNLAAEVEEEVMLQRLQEEKNKSIAEVSVFYDDLCKRHRKMEEVIEQVVGANEKHVAAKFDDYILNMKKIHEELRKQDEVYSASKVHEEGIKIIEIARSKNSNI